jgi:uncharacterized YccA/Bax inhibitor family protein
MAIFKSGNPTLSEKLFEKSLSAGQEQTMTARGTMNKFGFLFLMVMATAIFSWNSFFGGKDVTGYMWTGMIGGLIVALVIIFKQTWAPYLAPAYALFEGLFVGSISAIYQNAFGATAPSIVMQAILLTFGTVVSMYLLFNFRIIKATERFKSIVFMATAGIAVFYLITMVLHFFGMNIPFIHEGSLLGIGFSVFVVAIASLNLILDFDMIEKGTEMGAPKYMEWYCAFGLLVTIVWLYIEMLRLLGKLSSRD